MTKQRVEPPTGAEISALTGGSSRDRSSHAFPNPLNPKVDNFIPLGRLLNLAIAAECLFGGVLDHTRASHV